MKFHLKASTRLIILTCLALALTFNFTHQKAQAQGPQDDQTIFLPLVIRGNDTTPPPPQPIGSAFFIEPNTRTANAGIAVDKQGGMHLAYSYFLPDTEHPAAVYLTCPPTADCTEAAHWNGVSMLDFANEVQLGLTPAGQPRLLIRINSTNVALGNDYYYAACDQDCANPDQWIITYLTTTSGMASVSIEDVNTPQRSFALDPQGRPRFVYLDNTAPDHRGTFYAYCDDQCTDSAFWSETKISLSNDPFYEHYYYPSLAFTNEGQPRVVGDGLYLLQGQPLGIYYLACDSNCDDSSNWQRTRLFDRGSGVNVSWDLEMNGSAPRLAFYEGAQLGGAGDVLYYAWCQTGCLNSDNWQGHDLGLAWSNGRHPDLELDSQGRPRIAYALYDVGGLGYSWCTGNCESAGAAWQHKTVETRTDLFTAWQVAYPPHCDGGLWDGLTPALALDTAGHPRIAYDTAYHAQCWYDDPYDNEPQPIYKFHLIERSVRVNYFQQP